MDSSKLLAKMQSQSWIRYRYLSSKPIVSRNCCRVQGALDALRAAGVGYAQGFGIRKPAPLDSVAEGTA
jgi:hypothetical protein